MAVQRAILYTTTALRVGTATMYLAPLKVMHLCNFFIVVVSPGCRLGLLKQKIPALIKSKRNT